jgi:uncharacterized protein YndB with AHSA1/START domain
MSVTSSGKAVVTLPADDQILIEREFDAPVALVWRAVTEPELVQRWWGGQRGGVVSAEIDLRVGGTWRYTMRAPGFDGELGWHGEYREIVAGERVVSTEVFEGFPDAESVNTMTLVETAAGTTLLRTLVQHSSPENRDGHVNSGMEGGMQEAFDALEAVAQSLV